MAKFCQNCGSPLGEGTRFCPTCGMPVAAPAPQLQQPAYQQPAPPAAKQPLLFNAPAAAGEVALGQIGGAATAAASGWIPSPVKVIGTGISSFFHSIKAAAGSPARLLPAAILAFVWLILNILQALGVHFLPLEALSFLTFARGGMQGGVLGAIGGIFGKGLFAGALTVLIAGFTRKSGEKTSFGDRLCGAFGVSGDTLWAYLCGAGAAMLLYLFISGGNVRFAFMGGVAASYLAARSALTGGFVQKLAAAVISKGKTAAAPGATGFVRGLAAGFAAGALLGLTGFPLFLIIPGTLLTLGGAVMMILAALGVVKCGKGEAKR